MDLIQVQASDLAIGQPLPWNLFDQTHKPIQKRGYIIKTTDELKKLEASSIFRDQKVASEQIQSGKNKSDPFSFEDMQLKVGHKLQLKLSSQLKETLGETNNNFYMAVLIGYVQDNTLIVSMPASDPLTGEPFLEGEQILVRLFSGQCVFSFTVFVDKIIKLPFKYLHLSFPKHISSQTIRKSRRIKCNISASVSDKSTPLVITDLSTTGAEISTTASLGELGAIIMLCFTVKILDQETPLSVKSIIRSTKQTHKNDQKTLYFGIEFTELKSDQVFALRSLIYQEIVENPYHAAWFLVLINLLKPLNNESC